MARAFVASVLAMTLTTAIAAESNSVISDIDLSRPFATRETWRLVASQGPPVEGISDQEPGQIRLCLRAAPTAPCDPQLQNEPTNAGDVFSEPHYLRAVKIVYPHGLSDPPLLFIQTGSLRSGDGDQLIFTQMLAYEKAQNRFVRIYKCTTGRNNNQEVRYIGSGPMKGDIVSVDPTENAPYGYWVTVISLTPEYTYESVLHYRSATRYGDNNPLAVIDSEMPNIEQRMGFWKPGLSLPIPPGACPRPRLIHLELWCK